MSAYLDRPRRELAEVLRERELRGHRVVFVPCAACEGKGGWEDDLAWLDCPYCGATGGEEAEIEALPIEQKDLPDAR